jgi:serine/threonine protein kinase/tetratricopeptide (TPR) repeat protein
MDKTQADPRIGAVLGGRYRITTLLGEGGMGLVYAGERLQLGRPVAIKFLHSPYARSPKFVQRFEREARAMSKLSHPHCVSVIDFGVQDAPYIVMDFVTGQTLREVLDEGAMSPARALTVLRQVLFGLAHAHAEGVIHRDIKPGNIMLGELAGIGEHVRIFDFGLAKLRDNEVDGDVSHAHVVGTPAYMAPEQARADKIDARVDLYATGVLMFEMLAGQKPFIGDDAYAVLCMQRDKAPPLLRSLEPDLSPEIEQVVSRALEKDVDKRFQTAAEFIAAIDAVPEATGRPSVLERELISQAIGTAKTEHQLMSPVSSEGELSADKAAAPQVENSLAGTSRRKTLPARRSSSGLRFVAFTLLAGFLALALFLRGGGDEPEQSATTPASTPAAQVAESPAAEPVQAEPEAPEPVVPTAHVEAPAEAPAEPPLALVQEVAEAGVEAPEAEDADAALAVEEDLSEAALAAADEALNQTDEKEATELDAGTPRVTTVAGVNALVRQNKLDEAINALRALRKKSPKSAELPYLMGDLYFDRGWWSDGLAKYREAIKMSRGLRNRVSVQRNAIRAFADDRTYPRARALLVKDVGYAAAARLRKAAKTDPSRVIRKRASAVLARL